MRYRESSITPYKIFLGLPRAAPTAIKDGTWSALVSSSLL